MIGDKYRSRQMGGVIRTSLAVAISVVTAFVLFFSIALPMANAQSSDEKTDTWSFYTVASNMATAYSNTLSPVPDAAPAPSSTTQTSVQGVCVQAAGKACDGPTATEAKPEKAEDTAAAPASEALGKFYEAAPPGSAGSLIGYADAEVSGLSGWLSSFVTQSSNAIDYRTFKDGSGAKNYLYYGALLSYLGLDTTGGGSFDMGAGRLLGGAGVFFLGLLFILAQSASLVFKMAIYLIEFLNPFSALVKAAGSVKYGSHYSHALGAVVNPDGSAGLTDGVADTIAQWYGAIVNTVGWGIVVPVSIVLLVITVLGFKKTESKFDGFKKLFIRILWFICGIPLVGMAYTGAINSTAEMYDSLAVDGGGTTVINRTYLDFGGWMENNGLAVPKGATLEWNANKQYPTVDTLTKLPDTVLAINSISNKDMVQRRKVAEAVQDDPFLGAFKHKNDKLIKDLTNPEIAETTEKGGSGSFMASLYMLVDYALGTKVSSSDVETMLKGDLTAHPDQKSKAIEYFNVGKDGTGLDPAKNPLISVNGIYAVNGTNNNGIVSFSTEADNGFRCNSIVTGVADTGGLQPCGMSPLARYNYLNTVFYANSATVYSPKNTVSIQTRPFHYRVTLAGSSWYDSFGLYFSGFFEMLALVIIGYAYGFSLVGSIVKRALTIIIESVKSGFGSLRAMAKVVSTAGMGVVELVGVIFIYNIIVSLLSSIHNWVRVPLQTLSNGSGVGATLLNVLNSTGVMTVVTSVITIILYVVFIIIALRVRKQLLASVEEVLVHITNVFFSAENTPNAPKAPGIVGPSLAAAGGMAAGAMIGNARKPGDKSKPSGPKAAPGVTGTEAKGDSSAKSSDNGDPNDPKRLPPGDDPNGGKPNGPTDGSGQEISLSGDSKAIPSSTGSDKELADRIENQGGLNSTTLGDNNAEVNVDADDYRNKTVDSDQNSEVNADVKGAPMARELSEGAGSLNGAPGGASGVGGALSAVAASKSGSKPDGSPASSTGMDSKRAPKRRALKRKVDSNGSKPAQSGTNSPAPTPPRGRKSAKRDIAKRFAKEAAQQAAINKLSSGNSSAAGAAAAGAVIGATGQTRFNRGEG